MLILVHAHQIFICIYCTYASIGYEFNSAVPQAVYKGWVSSSVLIQHKQAASVIQYASIHQDPNSIKVLCFHVFFLMFSVQCSSPFNHNLKVSEHFSFSTLAERIVSTIKLRSLQKRKRNKKKKG